MSREYDGDRGLMFIRAERYGQREITRIISDQEYGPTSLRMGQPNKKAGLKETDIWEYGTGIIQTGTNGGKRATSMERKMGCL